MNKVKRFFWMAIVEFQKSANINKVRDKNIFCHVPKFLTFRKSHEILSQYH